MQAENVLMLGGFRPKAVDRLRDAFSVHPAQDETALAHLPGDVRQSVRGLANGMGAGVNRGLLTSFPSLEIVASFGVGYDAVDTAAAAERGIIVTNTPDVLTEEVADTGLGLLLNTVRRFSAAERYLRAGKWANDGDYPLTPTLRDRTVGIAGLGLIGGALARRLDAMQVPVSYHSRRERSSLGHRFYADLAEMARDVDTLVNVLPGGKATHHKVDATILSALGPNGIFINIGRGSTVDQPALVAALSDGVILAAGLDVFADEPNVPADLMALDNAVLFPHVGSASAFTRDAMGDLVVSNLVSWFRDHRPLTPVPETPWPAVSS